jgi:hypothetical protein
MIVPSSEVPSACEITHCHLNGKYIGDLGIPICGKVHVPEGWVAYYPKNHDRRDLRLGEYDRRHPRRRSTAPSVVPTAIDPWLPKLIGDPFLPARGTGCYLSPCWLLDREGETMRAD